MKHSSTRSGVTTPGREISQELVLDPFRRSSSILPSLLKLMSVRDENQRSFRKANKYENAQWENQTDKAWTKRNTAKKITARLDYDF